MFEINSERKLTRQERLAVVIAVAIAIAVHAVVFLGGGGFQYWTTKEKKKERLMVIRQVRDIAPTEDLKGPSIPRPQPQARPQPLEPAPAGLEGKAGGAPAAAPPPVPAKARDKVLEPAKGEPELTEKMAEEVKVDETAKPEEKKPGGELSDNAVSVVTDLSAATFSVIGPQEYRGSGTFWLRKGAEPGRYAVSFNPVAGYATPPPQAKELVMRGQIVFVGKYKKSHEIIVNANIPEAQFTIFRPDGRALDMNTPGRGLFDDLPSGNYTVVFKEVPGFITPSPIVRNLAGEGRLEFFGEYKEGGGARTRLAKGGAGGGGGDEGGNGTGSGSGQRGSGPGGGGTGGRGTKLAPAVDPGLDRRIQIVVTSYPKTRIEDDFDYIPYPEVIIHKSNYQKGWCQVYLIVYVDEAGDVEKVLVERPNKAEREQYKALIDAVETAVRRWDYDRIAAQVHIDARFYVE